MSNIQIFEPAKLSAVLTQNQGLSKRAVEACKNALTKAPDIKAATVEQLDETDTSFMQLIAKADDAVAIMDADRKPLTKKMDELKVLFTSAENEVKEVRDELKAYRNSIAAEKAFRQREFEQKQQQAIAAQQAEIDVRKELRLRYETALSNTVQSISDRMWKAFYSQSTETIDEWMQKTLSANVPYNHSQLVGNVMVPTNPLVNVMPIATQVGTETAAAFSEEWSARIEKLKQEIQDVLPARKNELAAIANDAVAAKEAAERIAREAAEREAAAKAEAEAKAQALATQAEADKLNAAFEQAAESGTSIQQAAGTSVKLKYNPTSHAGYVAILQWWVQNAMHLMTLDELSKKLSFMKTAAEKALNEGVKLDAKGLEVVEDYTTRKTAKAA